MAVAVPQQRLDMAHEPKDTFFAILLSHFRDPQHLDRLLEQDWVPEWTGWRELQAKPSDAQCLVLAQRFMAVLHRQTNPMVANSMKLE